jgi:hypothetical protein
MCCITPMLGRDFHVNAYQLHNITCYYLLLVIKFYIHITMFMRGISSEGMNPETF